MVKYVYDAWGKFLSTTGSLASTLGTIRLFRYRSYVYDQETGLYYLRSRYYNPVWLRFINPDSIVDGNLYQYCNNNPICFLDNEGTQPDYLGEIHTQVQERICISAIDLAGVFIDREVRVDFVPPIEYSNHMGHAYGYADLYNPETGEMWEVKPKGWNRRDAIAQLKDYVNGNIHRGHIPGTPSSQVGYNHDYLTGEFSYISKSNKTFDVAYWYDGCGIIKYKYTERKERKKFEMPSSESILGALWTAIILLAMYCSSGMVQLQPRY